MEALTTLMMKLKRVMMNSKSLKGLKILYKVNMHNMLSLNQLEEGLSLVYFMVRCPNKILNNVGQHNLLKKNSKRRLILIIKLLKK